MGLLDRHKRKPAQEQAPAAIPATTTTASENPLSAEGDNLRDMLIAAIAARDQKLFARLVNANRQKIAESFSDWQRVPESVRTNEAAVQRYGNTLVALAQFFHEQFGDSSIIQKLSGPGQAPGKDAFQAQWEQMIGQADTMAQELRFDDAKALLQQITAALSHVPTDSPIPFHAVTHGRLAHALFASGDVENAIKEMSTALDLSEVRQDNQGVAAAVRGLYEMNRYLGKTAEAADLADRLSAQLATMDRPADADFWKKQAALVRAGEPLCRIVFFFGEQQVEVADVPKMTQASLRYGFVRNRPPLALAEGLVQRGMQAGSQAKFTEALDLFRQAAKVDPHDPNPPYQSALTLMHLEKPAEAVAAYDVVDKLAPGWFNSRSERWLATEVAAGRLEQAIFFILRTEEMPDSAATWPQKLSLVDQAIARAGEIAPLLLYRGRCLLRMGNTAEAEPVLRAALEKATEPDTRTRALVDVQMVTSDAEEKRRLLQEAITLNGNLAAAAVARVTLKQMDG